MRPDALDAARVLALALVAVGGVSLLGYAGVPGDAAGLIQQGLFLAVPLAYAAAAKLRPLADSGFRKVGWRPLALVLLASLASLWLLKGMSELQPTVYRRVGLEKQIEEEERRIERSVGRAKERGGLYAVVLFGVASPLCEEVLFRGLALRGLAARFGPAAAVGTTAALFAVLHGTLVQVALMFFLGLYWGAIAFLTGSLWPGIMAHAVNNFAVLTLTQSYGRQILELPTPWWMLVLAALVFGLCLALLFVERRRPAEGS
jgi:membrane protease YdiL (CAAX protease family)